LRTLLACCVLLVASFATAEEESTPPWRAFDVESLRAARDESGRSYNEFLRVPSMFAGIYELEAGEFDRQTPHDRDELYVLTAGTAKLFVDGEEIAVEAGSIVFVAAGVEHRFLEITEAITVLVFFSEMTEK
jgi:mannose-6-phosphate isomerase-like protein (cupin superfamily)